MSLHLLCEKLPGGLGLQTFVQSESASADNWSRSLTTRADYVNFLKGEQWRQRIELNLDSPLQGPELLRYRINTVSPRAVLRTTAALCVYIYVL